MTVARNHQCSCWAIVLVVGIVLAARQHGWAQQTAEEPPQATLARLPATVPFPPDNPTTSAKVALGKQLFFDPRLAGNNQMSCATCHVPEKAFGDGLPVGRGADDKPLTRNTQTLLNVAFYSNFFWDGRAESLEQQALGPIQSAAEMNQDLAELIQELRTVPGYVTQFQAVFRTNVTADGIAKALAAFERTLVTRNSPFDRYLAGDSDALSAEAKLGMDLFLGTADCVRCHKGPLLSDNKFYRLGVEFRDKGRGAISDRQDDWYKFRTPSLREVARTAPYMHDGSMETLSEVVEFYFRTVSQTGPDGLALDIEPMLDQTYADIAAVVAFLEALTGEVPAITPPELP